MKRQIRHGVFETNSSSTHAICISTVDEELSIPETIEFGFGDYGWEEDTLSSRRDRANYLYTCLAYSSWDKVKEYIEFIKTTLREAGVNNIYFDDLKIGISTWGDDKVEYWVKPGNGYVDHGEQAFEFVEAVCSNKKLLLDYLFSDKSYILTGNDNNPTDISINENYFHEEFYKDN